MQDFDFKSGAPSVLNGVHTPVAVNSAAFQYNFHGLRLSHEESVLVSQCMERHVDFESIPVEEELANV